MATTLRDVVETAAQTFRDHFLEKQLEQTSATAFENLTLTESLAAYLIKEFTELHDAESSDTANLERIA